MKKILLGLLCGVMLLCITGCGKSDTDDIVEKYGSVEKENVEILVAKFNTEVVENNSDLNPASFDYLTEIDDQYWYGLIEGIYLVVVPEKYTGNKTNDIVDDMVIYVYKTTEYEAWVMDYVKYLIKANNNNITDSEIEALLKEAKEKAPKKETANNGKGISIGYREDDEMYQYQVIRVYE